MRRLWCVACACWVSLGAGAAAQSPWPVDATPELAVAAQADGAVRFELALAAVRTARGETVVVDAQGARVVRVAPDGRVVATVGRAGAGPNEFRRPVWIGRCAADSLAVFDLLLSRVTVLTPAGEIARQVTLPGVQGASVRPTCAADGGITALVGPKTRTPRATDPRLVHTTAAVSRFNRDGAPGASGPEVRFDDFAVFGGGGMWRPLAAPTLIAATGTTVWLADGEGGTVRVVRPDGSLGDPTAIGERGRAAQAGHRAAAVERLLAQIPPAMHDRMRGPLTELTASTLPPFFALFADPRGVLWVQTSPPGATPTSLVGVRDGRPVGRLEVPRAIEVFDVSAAHVTGVGTTADGEQELVAYRFRRPP